jgi:hypothetical protein
MKNPALGRVVEQPSRPSLIVVVLIEEAVCLLNIDVQIVIDIYIFVRKAAVIEQMLVFRLKVIVALAGHVLSSEGYRLRIGYLPARCLLRHDWDKPFFVAQRQSPGQIALHRGFLI